MIYVRADTHGNATGEMNYLANKHFPQMKELTPDDVIIIAGDFGFVWGKSFTTQELYWLNWMASRKPKFCFVAGNHENYTRLNSNEFPTIPMFEDEVKKIYDNVFMLQTGHIYTIDNKKVFTFGGGMSIDKERRIRYISWWEEEIPNYAQIKLGFDNLEKVGNKVDLIVSHATHQNFYEKMFLYDGYKEKDPLHKILEEVRQKTQYNVWVCGHYHRYSIDKETKSICLYNEIKSYSELYHLFHEDFI